MEQRQICRRARSSTRVEAEVAFGSSRQDISRSWHVTARLARSEARTVNSEGLHGRVKPAGGLRTQGNAEDRLPWARRRRCAAASCWRDGLELLSDDRDAWPDPPQSREEFDANPMVSLDERRPAVSKAVVRRRRNVGNPPIVFRNGSMGKAPLGASVLGRPRFLRARSALERVEIANAKPDCASGTAVRCWADLWFACCDTATSTESKAVLIC
jgi:hypothetical protein